MTNRALVVARTNFRTIKPCYLVSLIMFGLVVISDLVQAIIELNGVYTGFADGFFGAGQMIYMLLILGAVLIPARNFRKMMNLGAKRSDFFAGCALTYIIMAAVVSLVGLLFYYTYDSFFLNRFNGWSLNMLVWFKWIDNGPVIAFFQQFAFFLMVGSVIHTLTAAQGKWYGYAADAIIAAVISVFTPIASLRAVLVSFFDLIIFERPLFQIPACLIIAVGVYLLNRFIFARKAI